MTLATAAAVLLTLGVMVVALYLTEQKQVESVLRERLIATAYGASTAVDGDSLVTLSRLDGVTPAWINAQTATRLFLRDSTGRHVSLTLIALDGNTARVVADSRWTMDQSRKRNTSWIGPPGLSDSVGNIIAGRNPVFWFEREGGYEAIAPIYREATIPAGFAVASARRGTVTSELLAGLFSLAVFPLLALTAALALASYLSGRLTSRITALADHARAITGGDLSRNVSVEARDEVGALAGALQHMTERLRHILHEAEANARNEAIGRLAGTVAHDFNNVLTIIRGTAELMRESLPANHEVQDDIAEILAAANRAAELTSQLLVFTRERVKPKGTSDLNDMIDRSAGMLGRLAGPNVNLTTVLEPGPLTVSVEPGQFDRVVVNLVVNARDAMPAGGVLEIRTQSVVFDAQNPPPPDAGVQPGSYAQIRVSDSGVGMPEEIRVRAFEPFFTTKAPGKGTGLGLASSRMIIRKCGGDIIVDSVPGQGTAFTVLLPLATETGAVASAPEARRALRGGSETVLLVDDEDGVRSVAQKILEKRGYRILAARHAEEALGMEREFKERIDLLLTDVMMPGMDGSQLAAAVRLRRPQLRVLFMSGYADPSVFDNNVADASSGFLHKPFTMESLTTAVRAALKPRQKRVVSATP